MFMTISPQRKYLQYKFDNLRNYKRPYSVVKDDINVLGFHDYYYITIDDKVLTIVYDNDRFRVSNESYNRRMNINEMNNIVKELNNEFKELKPLIELGLI